MSSTAIPEEMPAWFSGFNDFLTNVIPKQQTWISMLQELVDKQSEVSSVHSSRIDKLEKVLNKLDEWKRTCFNVLRAEIAQSHSRQEQLIDECEIRVSNIPATCKMEPLDIATSVLSSVGCAHLCSQIVHARIWNIPNNLSSTRSIVFQLNSPLSRDRAMRNASRLSNLTIRDVLQIESSSRLYMNQLFPKPVYLLYQKACNRASELGYMRPIVRDFRVFMRVSRDSELIPVHSETDLALLQNNVPSCQSETVKTSTKTTVDANNQAAGVSVTHARKSRVNDNSVTDSCDSLKGKINPKTKSTISNKKCDGKVKPKKPSTSKSSSDARVK